MLRLKWITDIHNCHNDGTINALPVKNAPARRAKIHQTLDEFVEQTRKEKPTVVVNTGDNIDTTRNYNHDLTLQSEVHARLSILNGALISTAGNHDVSQLNAPELHTRFGIQAAPQLIHDPAASIIIWNADPTPHLYNRPKYYYATEDNLADLETLLSRTQSGKPVLLFSHIPVVSDAGTRPIDSGELNNPDKSGYINAHHIHDIIAHSGRKVVAFSGHRHINRIIQYTPNLTCITMDRLYRDTPEKGRPLGINIATIELKKNRLRIKREGAAPRDIGFTL